MSGNRLATLLAAIIISGTALGGCSGISAAASGAEVAAPDAEVTAPGSEAAAPGAEVATSISEAAAPQTEKDTATKPEQEGIYNYLEYSDRFASSGQPTAAQLKAQKTAGVERVVYIAFSDQEHALPAEDRIAKDLGLNYLHIPVDWKAPQKRDYYLFAQALQLEPERKTLLHCQANFRATAFALLYRVLHEGVPLGLAKADMNSVWVPNSIWTAFILDVLKENNVDTACSACDWTPSTIGE